MLPLFEESGGVDGRVSLEVLPELATATDKTVAEGLRLAAEVGRPNVMIKVPATPEGIPAIRALTARGVSVNVTLIFSLLQYEEVLEAYLAGLEDRDRGGRQARWAGLASASFFVSRVDSSCDKLLKEKAAAAPRAGGALRGAARQAGDRERQARVRDLRAHDRLAALEQARRRGRAPAAAAVGVDRHQGPALPGHLLRRRADRPATPSTRCRPRRWTRSSITASRRRACATIWKARSGRSPRSRPLGLDLSRVCHGAARRRREVVHHVDEDAARRRRRAARRAARVGVGSPAAGRCPTGCSARPPPRSRTGSRDRALGARLGGGLERSSPPTPSHERSIKSRLGWLRSPGADAERSSPSSRRSPPT